MHARLRAAADRLISDCANLCHAVALLPADGPGARPTPGDGPVVAALRALLEQQRACAGSIEDLTDCAKGQPPGDVLAGTYLDALRKARDRILAAFDCAPDASDLVDALAGPMSESAAAYMTAAFDLADTAPELADDAIFLNWALFPDLRGRPDLLARQQRLARLAAERAARRRSRQKDEGA